jgi:hypothetical protein
LPYAQLLGAEAELSINENDVEHIDDATPKWVDNPFAYDQAVTHVWSS